MSTTKILMLALYRSQGEVLHPIRLAAVTDLASFKSDARQTNSEAQLTHADA